MAVESIKLADKISDINETPKLWFNQNELKQEGWCLSSDVRTKMHHDNSKRANIVKEIYKIENDYLEHLKNLVNVSY